jgi:hypothetical protein
MPSQERGHFDTTYFTTSSGDTSSSLRAALPVVLLRPALLVMPSDGRNCSREERTRQGRFVGRKDKF